MNKPLIQDSNTAFPKNVNEALDIILNSIFRPISEMDREMWGEGGDTFDHICEYDHFTIFKTGTAFDFCGDGSPDEVRTYIFSEYQPSEQEA